MVCTSQFTLGQEISFCPKIEFEILLYSGCCARKFKLAILQVFIKDKNWTFTPVCKLKINSRVLHSGVEDGRGLGDEEQGGLGRGGKERGQGRKVQEHDGEQGGQHGGEQGEQGRRGVQGGLGRDAQGGRGGVQHGGVRGEQGEVHDRPRGRPQPYQRRPK